MFVRQNSKHTPSSGSLSPCRSTLQLPLVVAVFSLILVGIASAEGFYPDVHYPLEGRIGFMDKKGKIVIAPQFIQIEPFSEGVAAVKVGNTWGKWGYIDHAGKWVIKPTFDVAHSFHDGIAVVEEGTCSVLRSTRVNGFCYFIDKTGKRLSPNLNSFHQTLKCSEGLIPYFDEKSMLYGFIDKSGKMVVNPQFKNATGFSEGLAAVEVRETRKWGYIDKTGTLAIKPEFDFCDAFSEGLGVAVSGQKAGYINKQGQFVIKPQFADARPFKEGLAVVGIESGSKAKFREDSPKKYGFISPEGKFVIPAVYDGAGGFSDGFALVDKNEKSFLIDRKGKRLVTKEDVDFSLGFSDGLAPIGIGMREGFIDKSGRPVIRLPVQTWAPPGIAPFGATSAVPLHGTLIFSEGLCGVEAANNGGPKCFYTYVRNPNNTILAKNYTITTDSNGTLIKNQKLVRRIGPQSPHYAGPSWVDIGNQSVFLSRMRSSRHPKTGSMIEWVEQSSKRVLDGVSFDAHSDGYIMRWDQLNRELTVYNPDGTELKRNLPK